jgi:Flp pilus assembly protein CpaB
VPTSGTLPGRAALGRRPRRRFRVHLRRHPPVFWLIVVAAAGLAWWTTSTANDRASSGAEAYGSLVEVIVTTVDVPAGSTVDSGVTRLAALPRDLVPSGAMSQLPPGAVARQPMVEGEAVVDARLAPRGATGIAGTLALGERAIAIPLDPSGTVVEVEHRVDVLATTDPSASPGRDATRVVASDARVVAVGDEGIIVAVDEDDAREIATALASAMVTVVVGPG